MRSYKKIKLYTGGSLSKNNKGLILIHPSNISTSTTITINCNTPSVDGTSNDMSVILFPVTDSSSGLPFSPPTGAGWAILPFNVSSVSGNTSSANIYELF